MRKPEPYQVALLLLSLVAEREKVLKAAGKETAVSRFRLSEATFRRLAKRIRIPPDFFAKVQEWLFDAGWSLFFTGSSYYAMIKTDAVDGWVRLGSKRIIYGVTRTLCDNDNHGPRYDFKDAWGITRSIGGSPGIRSCYDMKDIWGVSRRVCN
jgi:hypothetical protein